MGLNSVNQPPSDSDARIYKIVVSDIDGCLLPKRNIPMDMSDIISIRELNRLSIKGQYPLAVTLCSGRPEPYVGLMMRLIDGYLPALFEWGAGLYRPASHNVEYHTTIDNVVREKRTTLEKAIQEHLVEPAQAIIQPGKEVAITLYPTPGFSVEYIYKQLQRIFRELIDMNEYVINPTQTCVDILPKGIDKGQGVLWLSDILQISCQQIIAIGDDESDISLLQYAGYSACPNNASDAVKELVNYISPFDYSQGVIDILKHVSQMEPM